MITSTVRRISECFIKPKCIPEKSQEPIHLTAWELSLLSANYIQNGLLFSKPSNASLPNNKTGFNNAEFLDKLKDSLSIALVHFYPLTGRLKTSKTEDLSSCVVYIDCNDSPGARFIHAAADITTFDVLSPTYVPSIVHSFFDHHKALNWDGHTMPLLSVQVTELVDGIFIGCSMNHCVADGISFWHFFNSLSEIFRANGNDESISIPPINKRWFPDGHGPTIKLPFTRIDHSISQFKTPHFKERIFHFSSESISKLKSKANSETKTAQISSLQSLFALVWRCTMRASQTPPDQVTSCWMPADSRSRLNPPLPENYLGNAFQPIRASTTVRELLDHNLGWAAWKLHKAVANHSDEQVREWLNSWIRSPHIENLEHLFDPCEVKMGQSPRFNVYGPEFGLGKALAVRGGYGNKFCVSVFPGIGGRGSMDLEICLPPDVMSGLESDHEFVDALS